ncbi:Thiol:disulfide interchange protein DsbC [Sinobacterium norvegicum]|uniref:Thiol:disulfide interchange protein n=1 Tax=Sinobacterium norvegicum TaxID=1641715 RepID=A0ABN8EFJ8_9GAMM|nr:DsbC family protein [Sinobacterium norvegicum]CAH0990784.1 Thiol:disulfide interchange protein DsbC [Sinobacterium norvegicum]
MLKAGVLQVVLIVAVLISAFSVQAAEAVIDSDQVLARIKQSRPDLQFGAVEQSPMKDIYQVQIVNGPLLYINPQGSHFVAGELFEVAPSGVVNLTEMAQNAPRKALMAGVDSKDMIIFAPAGETKATVTVFTDVDCYYCQKLHQEVPALNKLGVAVQYMAYPRAGIGSESYNKIASAWCADDKQEAMNKLKARQNIAKNVCADNPVAEQYELGGRMGVSGTPALVLEDGSLVPGYMPANELAKRLGIQ